MTDKESLIGEVGERLDKGKTQAEIARELKMDERRISYLAGAYYIIKAEREKIEERLKTEQEKLNKEKEDLNREKEEHRTAANELKNTKAILEKLKKEKAKIEEEIKQLINRESTDLNSEIRELKSKKDRLEHECSVETERLFNLVYAKEENVRIYKEAADFEFKKEELIANFEKLKQGYVMVKTNYDILKAEINMMKDMCAKIKEGVIPAFLDFYNHLSPQEKAALLSNVENWELEEIFSTMLKAKIFSSLMSNMSNRRIDAFTRTA